MRRKFGSVPVGFGLRQTSYLHAHTKKKKTKGSNLKTLTDSRILKYTELASQLSDEQGLSLRSPKFVRSPSGDNVTVSGVHETVSLVNEDNSDVVSAAISVAPTPQRRAPPRHGGGRF